MPLEHRVEPFVEQQAKRDVECGDERDRRRERRVELRLRRARALPVEVEPRRRPRRCVRRLRHRTRPEARRRHQCLLRAGDDDVQTPRIRLARDCAEARDGVDDDERAAVLRRGGDRLHVRDDAGRGLGLHDPDRLRLTLAQPRTHVVGVGRLTPRVAQVVDVGPVRRGHRRPALAEATRGDDEMRVIRRHEVLHRGLECTGAGRREEQDVLLGPAHLAQPREATLVDRPEVGTAVMDDRLPHRRQHLRRNRSRPRGEQILLRHLPQASGEAGLH
jgi:hypothetical protein